MTTTDRSTVLATFTDLEQANKAIAQLEQAGFSRDLIGLAGPDKTVAEEKKEKDIAVHSVAQATDNRVVLAVKAGERWKEVLSLLCELGAVNTTPTLEEISDYSDQINLNNQQPVEPHLEYDPIAGPRATTENTAPIDTTGYGLQRDPALDADVPTGDLRQPEENKVAEREASDTFFGQPVKPNNTPPDTQGDPNTRHPRSV
jgi:hypothetical protein